MSSWGSVQEITCFQSFHSAWNICLLLQSGSRSLGVLIMRTPLLGPYRAPDFGSPTFIALGQVVYILYEHPNEEYTLNHITDPYIM